MEWVVFDDGNMSEYQEFIDSQEYAGVWHQPCWLSFQKTSGKITDGFFFAIKDDAAISFDGAIILGGLILIQKLKFGKYAYIPGGIIYNRIDEKIYNFFVNNLKRSVSKYGAFFTQTDSITPFNDELGKITAEYKNHIINRKLPIPQFTSIIQLGSSLDGIMDNMKPKGRYNIKLAEKKGVVVKTGGVNDIPAFYKLLKETSLRDGFIQPNTETYYRLMLEQVKNTVFLLAYHEDDLLCANIFTYTKHQGLYYYGASSNVKRNLMAPYLVQWEAIKIATDRGCKYFDFMGVSDPAITSGSDSTPDRLAGVTEFKLKFGGEVVKFQTPYRIVHNRPGYSMYEIFRKFPGRN